MSALASPARGLHPFAWRCRDAEETRHFYENVLGLPLAHLIRLDRVPSTGEYCPYVHIFFEMTDGSCIALFDLGDGQAPAPSPNTPDWVTHIAMRMETRLCATHLSNIAWTFGQMRTHHCSNGCDLRPGDLLGSGTVSGEVADERACLTEITSAGREPLRLSTGDERLWLQDGKVTFKAQARADGRLSIGFGGCSGRVLPAVPYPLPRA